MWLVHPLRPVASILGKQIFMYGSTSQTSGPSPWGTHMYGLKLHVSKDETESYVTGKMCCVCVQRATQNCAEEGVHRPGLQHRGWRRGGGHLCLLHTGWGACRPQWRVETRRQDLVCEYMHALGFIATVSEHSRVIVLVTVPLHSSILYIPRFPHVFICVRLCQHCTIVFTNYPCSTWMHSN